ELLPGTRTGAPAEDERCRGADGDEAGEPLRTCPHVSSSPAIRSKVSCAALTKANDAPATPRQCVPIFVTVPLRAHHPRSAGFVKRPIRRWTVRYPGDLTAEKGLPPVAVGRLHARR